MERNDLQADKFYGQVYGRKFLNQRVEKITDPPTGQESEPKSATE